jgi:hypothetical protein
MAAHLVYEDFLRFLGAVASHSGDPWELYQRLYVDRHRAVIEAWWRQCMGLPDQVWADRVRRVRPQDYGLLQEVAGETDLVEIARDAMARCQRVAPLSPEPEVYYLVGFFSPHGFAFEVEGAWAIGIGMERLGSLRLVPLLLAHEYAHCRRRALGRPRRLGGRLVDEGFAVELSRRAFPDRSEEEHLLMSRGQVAALRDYEAQLWAAVSPLLDSEDEGLAARVLYGRAGRREWPSRAGMYLGWRVAHDFLERHPGRFDAPAETVLSATGVEKSGGCAAY